jgi:hypothetical protein
VGLAAGLWIGGQHGDIGDSSALFRVSTLGSRYEVGQEVPQLRREVALDDSWAVQLVASAEVPTLSKSAAAESFVGLGDERGGESVVSYTALGEIVASYDWPINEAFAITSCESNWNPEAVSWTGARGLMQLMPLHAWRFAARGWDYWTDWSIPERNVAIAHEIWLEQSWIPWIPCL